MITNDLDDPSVTLGTEDSKMDVCLTGQHEVPSTSSASVPVSSAGGDGSVTADKGATQTMAKMPMDTSRMPDSKEFFVEVSTDNPDKKILLESSFGAEENLHDSANMEVSALNITHKMNKCEVEKQTCNEEMDVGGQEIIHGSNKMVDSKNQNAMESKLGQIGNTEIISPGKQCDDGHDKSL